MGKLTSREKLETRNKIFYRWNYYNDDDHLVIPYQNSVCIVAVKKNNIEPCRAAKLPNCFRFSRRNITRQKRNIIRLCMRLSLRRKSSTHIHAHTFSMLIACIFVSIRTHHIVKSTIYYFLVRPSILFPYHHRL